MKRVKTVKQDGIRQSLLLAGLALVGLATSYNTLAAQAIVGSWYINSSDTHVVTTFLADGTYFESSDYVGDPTHTGVEWGNYSWNAITGEITAASLGDTNGNWGIANDEDGPQYGMPSGNTVTFWQPGCAGGCSGSGQRILHPADSIVGTWLLPPDSGAIGGTISFFADGSYIMGQGGVAVGDGVPGMERGTYSWNSVTGALTSTIITDTNGDWGLSHPIGSLTATITASGDLLGGDDGGLTLLTAAPVPEPETYAMMLAGLGLVGFAARRRAAV